MIMNYNNQYAIIIKSQAFNNTWDCRIHTASRTGYITQFPFFTEVSANICNMLEHSIAEINKSDDILQEKTDSDVVDMTIGTY